MTLAFDENLDARMEHFCQYDKESERYLAVSVCSYCRKCEFEGLTDPNQSINHVYQAVTHKSPLWSDVYQAVAHKSPLWSDVYQAVACKSPTWSDVYQAVAHKSPTWSDVYQAVAHKSPTQSNVYQAVTLLFGEMSTGWFRGYHHYAHRNTLYIYLKVYGLFGYKYMQF